jgi:DNA-binding NarL/FixJ family response regulator
MMGRSVRILLADDHTLMREGLKGLLDKREGFEVVGEAGDGRQALELAGELEPDVVVMDIGMPDLNGIEAARRIVEKLPRVRIVALSMHQSERMVVEMLRAGASAYVLKMSAFDEVARAVEVVTRGERYLSPAVAGVVVDRAVVSASGDEATAFSRLTPREREVLQLLAEGKSSKEIAFDLEISARTVDVHRKNLMDKLDLDSVAELTRYAIREGLVTLDE